ncbi:nucleotide exchange factor GrpE [Pseudonocardia sp. ICBG1034]|uniref:nucleotide exchange factor GrpE n=1 Tax=Pseudonocardia sp. ICBG1034 TaxID=2844381 RepID=UPI001CCE79C3|nr:nucleotide exchange factor GrpE [Pseudonocardia sp. ICBG1034]
MPEHRSSDHHPDTSPDDRDDDSHDLPGRPNDGPDLVVRGVAPVASEAAPPLAGEPADRTTQDPVADLIERIETTLAGTARALQDGAERAAARERVIDRQHAEIERLKAVERIGVMRPVIVELGRLRNDLRRQARSLRPDTTVERFASLLESFADSVADTLEGCGAEPLVVEPGSPFVAQRHRVASVLPTADPSLDATVADVVADGYAETDSGKVVAPARVVLHRLTEPAAEGATPAETRTGIGTPLDTPSTATSEVPPHD